MTLRLVVATANPDKAREIREVLAGAGLDIELVARPDDVPEVVEDGETLDIRLSIPVSSPSDLSISRWDNDHPYRLCPAKGMVFTSANADARDADGCLIWANGAKVLRAHAEMLKQATTAHLLKRYKEWVAKGKPAFDAH